MANWCFNTILISGPRKDDSVLYKSLEKEFTFSSERRGLHGLPGHRDAGGFRASIYNAMPPEGVNALIEFLIEFENKH